MNSESKFLQGVYQFQGQGLSSPFPLAEGKLAYIVPDGKYAQPTYFRGGNSSDALIYVVLLRDGVPMRYFPIGAKSDMHVALVVVDDLIPGTRIDLTIAAPDGIGGTVVVDLGLVLTNYEY